MDSPIDLIDLKSDNVIGDFESAPDALAHRQRPLQTQGPRAIHRLSLTLICNDNTSP